jgi:hypothetical protein
MKQFRKATFTKAGYPDKIEFLDFDTEKGDRLLGEMIEKGLVPNHILVSLF